MSSNLRYPTGQIVGVVPDRNDLGAVVDALHDIGVDDGRIHVLRSADAGGDDLAPDPGDVDGPVASLVQTVQKALGDEAARLEQLEKALDAGHDVIAVELATTEDDDATRTQKLDVGAALRGAGATDVAYYGRMQIEQLDASGTT